MKFNNALILAKGATFFIIGVFTPWSAALAQWIGTGEWPPGIVWIGVILPASAIGGASQLQAFLSTSWASYKAGRVEPDANKPVDNPPEKADKVTP